MTSKQFLIEKNKIVFDVTGLILIPKDQIIEHRFVRLYNDTTHLRLTTAICTYCLIYKNDKDGETIDECEDCPMHEAENYCSALEHDSTWI